MHNLPGEFSAKVLNWQNLFFFLRTNIGKRKQIKHNFMKKVLVIKEGSLILLFICALKPEYIYIYIYIFAWVCSGAPIVAVNHADQAINTSDSSCIMRICLWSKIP